MRAICGRCIPLTCSELVGSLPEEGSPALASIMAEANDKQSRVVGEKSTYAIDASGQKGDVRFCVLFPMLASNPYGSPVRCRHDDRLRCISLCRLSMLKTRSTLMKLRAFA